MKHVTTAKEADSLSPIASLVRCLLTSVECARLEGVELTVVHKAVRDLADDLADNLPCRTAPVADDPKVTALLELLKEARRDLADYVEDVYPEPLRQKYPSYKLRWDRDMELCRQIDTALAAFAPTKKETT